MSVRRDHDDRDEDRDVAPVPVRRGRYELLLDLSADCFVSIAAARVRGPNPGPRLVELARIEKTLAREVEFRETFLAEARAAGRVRHANFLQPTDTLLHDGELYVATELVHGARLSELLRAARAKGHALPPDVAVRLALDVLSGLSVLHATVAFSGAGTRALVHGDVAPENIVVTTRGVARLVHSGLSTATCRLDATREKSRRLAYKAPEQLRAGIDAVPLDPTADVFAVAAVLWEMLTNTAIFEAPTDALVVERILNGAPWTDVVATKRLSPDMSAVLKAGLRAGGEGTVESAEQFADMLRRAARGEVATADEVAVIVNLLAGEAIAERKKRVEARLGESERRSPPSGAFALDLDAIESGAQSATLPETGEPVILSGPSMRPRSLIAPRAPRGAFLPRAVGYVGSAMFLTAAALLWTHSLNRAPAQPAGAAALDARVPALTQLPLTAPQRAPLVRPPAPMPSASAAAPSSSSSAPQLSPPSGADGDRRLR